MSPRLLIIGLAVLAVISCSSKKKKAAEPAGPGSGSAVEPAEPAEPALVPLASEADLRAVVDGWLAAQNGGAFADYSALYAEKFFGVKRAGGKTTRYDRKGWLADRERMFKNPMVVSAADVKISSASASASIEFTQRWKSGKFEDVGPKRLLIVREEKGLRIAQEEMLASQLVGEGQRDKPVRFVVELDGEPYVLLDDLTAKGAGAPKLVDDEVTTAIAPMDAAEVAAMPALAAWREQSVVVDEECETKIEAFVAVARLEPHFGVVQNWDCDFDDDDNCEPASDAKKAADVFDSVTPMVAAKLADCEGMTARLKTTAAPVESVELDDDSALVGTAAELFGKLPEIKAFKGADGTKAEGNWWKSAVEIGVYKHPTSGEIIVSAYAEEGEVCGGDQVSVWQVWRVDGKKLVPIYAGAAPKEVVSAVDTDGDGHLELIIEGDGFGTERAHVDPTTGTVRGQLRYVYADCPC